MKNIIIDFDSSFVLALLIQCVKAVRIKMIQNYKCKISTHMNSYFTA